MRPVLCLHETVATGAADGYARMARHPSCVLLHLGVGLANGLSNLHNARRGNTPVVVLVGDLASWHAPYDPPLHTNIEQLADVVSCWTRRIVDPSTIPFTIRSCVQAAMAKPGVATAILCHDAVWVTDEEYRHCCDHECGPSNENSVSAISVDEAVAAIAKGKCGVFLGGELLLHESWGYLHALASGSGASLFCENGFARVDRGRGAPAVCRLPYKPSDARGVIRAFQDIVFLNTSPPILQFGYKDDSGALFDPKQHRLTLVPRCSVNSLSTIVDKLGLAPIVPQLDVQAPLPPLPTEGKLNPVRLCQALAHCMSEDVVVVDESITSGPAFWDCSKNCPKFSHLTLTGGAIGIGIPLSIGAAIACPSRKIVTFQADGSGQYSLQGLWTQAREHLSILTVICANGRYDILNMEMMMQGLVHQSPSKGLTDLGSPSIDWVSLAKGYGVAAVSVSTVEEFLSAFRSWENGPFLIEAVL